MRVPWVRNSWFCWKIQLTGLQIRRSWMTFGCIGVLRVVNPKSASNAVINQFCWASVSNDSGTRSGWPCSKTGRFVRVQLQGVKDTKAWPSVKADKISFEVDETFLTAALIVYDLDEQDRCQVLFTVSSFSFVNEVIPLEDKIIISRGLLFEETETGRMN